MFEGLPWELGQDHLGDLAGRSLSGLTPLQAADALLGADLLALLDVDQGVAEAVVAQLQVALNQVAALQAVFIEAVARRVERDVELAKDADRLQGSFPAGWGTGDDYTPSVLAPLLHLSPRTMSGRLAEARTLVNDLPRTLRVALDGELEPWRVAAVVAGATGVSSERLPDFEVALFGEHGVGDLAAYQRVCGPNDPAVPRLVIIVDEFRSLAEELPDFVAGLVRVASLGRSLGVHLVVATQRPAGVVTADMRANLGLRIALRVRDAVDSFDVVESPVAATIAANTPGRAVVTSAAMPLTLVQTCLLYTSPSPRDGLLSRMPSSA